jgi:hypothetical protein
MAGFVSVSKWYIFKEKIQTRENFGMPLMEDVGILYDHFVYLWTNGIFYGHLVHFVVIWYIFPRFGML